MAGFKTIKIFTDTNIIHTRQSHLLISTAVSTYISEHKTIESIKLKWYLPSMVLEERRHQMLATAFALNPKLLEIEKLLDHSLGISKEVMSDRVDSKINKIVKELDLEICDLDTEKVNWKELIQRSAQRKPPFEEVTEKKEKGFRDAVIATTFLQEVECSPVTQRVCLLIFVSGDKRIREYILEKTSEVTNVRVLEDLDELKSLLNAIASEVTEDFLKNLLPKTKLKFYDFEKQEGLYKKENIFKKILKKYKNKLNEVVENSDGSLRKESGAIIGQQTFIKKTGQTVVWSTSVILKFKVIKIDFTEVKEEEILSSMFPEPIVVDTGESQFSIVWQHQVTTKGNIIRLKINTIDFIENRFDFKL